MISNYTISLPNWKIYYIRKQEKNNQVKILIFDQTTSILAIVFVFPFANWKSEAKYKIYEETYYDSTIICKFVVTYHAKVPSFRIYKYWIEFDDQKAQDFW